MANFSSVTVTRQGRKHLSHAFATSTSISFDHMEIGNGVAPAAPEDLTGLVNTLTRIGIAKITEEPDGSIAVRGNFSAVGIAGDFYLREIGLYVKPFETGGSPILFAYANAGDQADFVPDTSGSTLMEEMLIVSLVMGGAKIMFSDIDPTARATVGDLQELKEEIDIESLRLEIKKATDSLGEAKEGFVEKTGDVMTGTLEAKEFIGPLTGSASMWCGWKNYTGLEDLNAKTNSNLNENTATIQDIVGAMELNSRLIHAVGYTSLSGSPTWPLGRGVLEIRKMKGDVADVYFTGDSGMAWAGIYWGTWRGWNSARGNIPGTMDFFAGSTLPLGSVWPDGREVSRSTYVRLFAVIGTTFGAGDGRTTFNVPDVRGRFPRCLDNGKGLDKNRTLGSPQNDAIRPIAGTFDANSDDGDWGKTGPFYRTNIRFNGANGEVGRDGVLCGFDVSRVVPTADEIRPTNIALNMILYY